MSKILSYGLALVGLITAASSTVACAWLFFADEPEMPKSLIER